LNYRNRLSVEKAFTEQIMELAALVW